MTTTEKQSIPTRAKSYRAEKSYREMHEYENSFSAVLDDSIISKRAPTITKEEEGDSGSDSFDDSGYSVAKKNFSDFIPHSFKFNEEGCFSADKDNKNFCYPSLYEEADEMLQLSLLIYTVTELRTLAKKRQKRRNRKQMKSNKFKKNDFDSFLEISESSESSLQLSESSLSSLELILSLPLSLETCLNIIDENFHCISQVVSQNNNFVVKHSLQLMRRRQQQQFQRKNSNRKFCRWWESNTGEADKTIQEKRWPAKNEVQEGFCGAKANPPSFVAYGDDNHDKDLVYAITIDPTRKRITVVFRGSVTLCDFYTVACIAFNQQPNPVTPAHRRIVELSDLDDPKNEEDMNGDYKRKDGKVRNNYIGIHHGFYEYMFKSSLPKNYRKKKGIKKSGSDEDVVYHNYDYRYGENNGGKKINNFTEIVTKLIPLFENNKDYKLYVTGHSLGGALATLFSFYVAAAIDASISENRGTSPTSTVNCNYTQLIPSVSTIPTPVSCISIASPRVGNKNFYFAFQSLERLGMLQHLRIVNDGDPITVVPRSPGKKIRSPFNGSANKSSCQTDAKKATYHHTGIKLSLYRGSVENIGESDPNTSTNGEPETSSNNSSFKIQYSCLNRENCRKRRSPPSTKSKSLISSIKRKEVPYFVHHFGYTYGKNIDNIKDELTRMSLPELYRQKVVVAT